MNADRSPPVANSESCKTFSSLADPAASNEFERWRSAHDILGHYLNRSDRYGWVLHRARCKHISMPKGSDLARHEKICCERREELERYATRHDIQYHRCQTCKPK